MERKERSMVPMPEMTVSKLAHAIIEAFRHSGIRSLKGEATTQAHRSIILYEELTKRGVDQIWPHCTSTFKRSVLEKVSEAKNETYQHQKGTSQSYLEGVILVALNSKGSLAYVEKIVQEERNRVRGF